MDERSIEIVERWLRRFKKLEESACSRQETLKGTSAEDWAIKSSMTSTAKVEAAKSILGSLKRERKRGRQ